MMLGISLIIMSTAGLFYGIQKKNNAMIVASVIALILIALIWVVYSYLYSLTPY
jgi:ammonia channel protein AmtB